MDKSSKERIKKLKEDKEYDKIFVEYGRKIYKKNVPLKYRRQDKKKLIKEKRYEDIFNKYGKSEYNNLLTKAMYDEIKQEQGSIKALIWRIKKGMIKLAKHTGLILTFSSLEISAMLIGGIEKGINENSIKYEEAISEYNERASEYAKEVQSMNLTDIQICMKVMDDMWSNIKGYAKPEMDIIGFWELDLATPEGYGVCRNMASDIAKKMNEINPKYNARTICVKFGEDGNYYVADIERTVLETNETVIETQDEDNIEINDDLEKLVQNFVGNHMVTLIDIPKENITLVLDPTNPSLGIYYQGNTIMFNSEGKEYDSKEYFSSIINGVEGFVNTAKGYIRSYKNPVLNWNEIETKYGLEAQNKALMQVRALKVGKDMELPIEKEFREGMKVDNAEQLNYKYELSEKNVKENNINNDYGERI